MRTKLRSGVIGLGVLLAAAPAFGHHKIADYYDATKPVILKGTVKEFIPANPHSFILLEVKSPEGVTDTWAVEGDGTNNLVAAGWDLRSSGWDFKIMLRPGDAISVTALPAKSGVKLADTLVIDQTMPRGSLQAMNRVMERQQAERLMHGLDVTLADGRKLLFGEAGR